MEDAVLHRLRTHTTCCGAEERDAGGSGGSGGGGAVGGGGRSGSVYVSRACGRVNVIGEHVDYNGFGVLPGALQGRHTMTAVRISADTSLSSTGGVLCVSHARPSEYPARVFEVVSTEDGVVEFVPRVAAGGDQCEEKEHPGDGRRSRWLDYVMAAVRGVVETRAVVRSTLLAPGIKTCLSVEGNVPPGGGLSSSSSLVVSVAQGLLAALGLYCEDDELGNDEAISKKELTEVCIQCERYVGTASGGMDQTAILMSRPGYLTHIEFEPTLRVTPTPLPFGIAFIVGNTGVVSAKAETAPFHYNKRWFECRVATFLLRRHLACEPAVNPVEDTFASVQRDCGRSLREMLEEARALFRTTSVPYSREEITEAIGQDTVFALLDGRCGRAVWEMNDDFYLLARTEHVLSEAQRVQDFVTLCANASHATAAGAPEKDEDLPEQLGRLMDESDASCDECYDCSCPELRELVRACRDAGALGARLTGAGWGGCAVAMVRADAVDTVLQQVRDTFYHDREGDISGTLFAFEPLGCSSVRRIQSS